MCGIVGYVGSRPASPILLEGLRRLEYRGYDSAGLAVSAPDALALHRSVGRVHRLESTVPQGLAGSTGIAHTRWATHGGVTQENAHPHTDVSGRIAVVHNGIVENMKGLRDWLQERGVQPRSETDTELIAHLIAEIYYGEDLEPCSEVLNGHSRPVAAVRAALQRVQGTWGVAVLFADHPDLVVAARNGSPLVIGQGVGETFLASDPQAILRHTREVVFLADGEIAPITPQGLKAVLQLNGGSHAPGYQTIEDSWGIGELKGFPHFMLKEIHEQSEAMRRCMTGRLRKTEGSAQLSGMNLDAGELRRVRQVGIAGCGTAYYAGQVGAMALERLAHVTSRAAIASEFRHHPPPVEPEDLYLAVSQSGETADTLGAVREVKRKGGQVAGVINVVGSTIARECGRGVYIHSGPEMAVASTKAFNCQVTALLMFSLMMARGRAMSLYEGQRYVEALEEVPEQIEAYLADPGPINEVAELVAQAKVVLFLGRGFSAPVASEGALKLMEVAYVPCVAYPSGEMKHGPIALLEEGSPVIVIAPEDSVREKTLAALHECRSRGAKIVLIHNPGDPMAEDADLSIPVPRTLECMSPLLTVLPLQLVAYHAGLLLGRDIDRPRNLAKSVTVE